MNKLIKLGKGNIKKHKKESLLLGLLIMLCVILLSGSIAAIVRISEITPRMVEESDCYKNFILIDQKAYSNKFLSFLEADERVEKYDHVSLAGGTVKIKNYAGTGTDQIYGLSFVSESSEKQMEKYELIGTVSQEEIAAMEYPIILDESVRDSLKVKEGDYLTIIEDKKEFTFQVAGFYRSGLWVMGGKAIVPDEEFSRLEENFDRYEVIGVNTVEGADAKGFFKEFQNHAKEISVNDISAMVTTFDYDLLVSANITNMAIVSIIVAIMAGVIVIAVMIIIRFRIVSDINEQMVSIGVLEAIGYKSGEIAFSYVLEYVMITMMSILVGFAPSFLMAKFLLKNAAMTVHYSGDVKVPVVLLLITMVAIMAFIALLAWGKARKVNKYPPVLAFRKGIGTHNFKASHLPLEKSKGNIHIRLALKSMLGNMRSCIGLFICILVTTIMILFSVVFGSFFGNGESILKTVSGHELNDIRLVAVGSVEPELFAEELRSLPEVEKVLLTEDDEGIKIAETDTSLMMVLYDDFKETSTIVVTKGRLPEHDNEIAITTQMNGFIGYKKGDTITLEYGKVKRDYIICGEVNSVVNGSTIYMTNAGFRRINPIYKLSAFDIYLKEGTDLETFSEILRERYGENISNISNSIADGDTYEEKLKKTAEIEMAKAMEEAGVCYMEYSVQVGDRIISGSTSAMKIQSMTYTKEFYEDMVNTITSAFIIISIVLVVLSGIVVMLILAILMSSTIRQQYKELGIMKGLGYTAGELKFQMAFKIIPPTFFAVIVGTILSVVLIGALESVLAKITISMTLLMVTDLAILLFCFLCAYISAGKIGKISVYELMTE